MKIIPHTKPEARQLQIRGLGYLLLAAITEAGGTLKLAGDKRGSKQHPAWRELRKVAPECFKGPRSDQRLWMMIDDLGIVISGGTSRTGPLTAALKEKRES